MTEKMITINGRQVPVFDDELTGDQLKQMAGLPHQERDKRQVVLQEGDRNVLVPDHRPIRVPSNAVFTDHARHSKAGSCAACRGTGDCPSCDGRGYQVYLFHGEVECSRCNGTGNCSRCFGSGSR